jgi:hypothetical protein
MTEQPILKIRKPPKVYPINFEKLKGESMRTLPYLLGVMGFSEDYEYFDKIKHLLIIPEEPKTLEEIQQELDEKFDDLLVRTKRKFAELKYNQEYHYNQKFETINGNFEYARENGFFPPKYTLSGAFDCSTLSVNSQIDISSPSFVIKQSNSHQGYYTIGEDRYYRFYMEKKPNMIFRFFVYKLMGFKWNDEDT